MKIYKSLIVGSLIVAVIISTPVLTFAESGVKNSVEVNQSSNSKLNNKSSMWNKLFSSISHRANAENDNFIPVISRITAPTVLKIGEVGTWKVKASSPQNGTLEYGVNWGDAISQPLTGLVQPVFDQTSTFTHAYTNIGKYTITFTVSNSAGLKATSTVNVNIVEQNVKAPIISNLVAKSIKHNKATIRWTTDVKANSFVWYSTISPVNTSVKPNVSRSDRIKNHKIELKKLLPNTKYYLIVGSTSRTGTTTSNETSFITLTDNENNSNSPVITNLIGPKTVIVGNTETVTVKAYDPKNGTLSYTADWGDTDTSTMSLDRLERPIFVQTATFSHVYNKVGTYTATFTAESNDGKKDSLSMKIDVVLDSVDVTAPVISSIKTLTEPTMSTISWITNEPSTSEIFYSTNTPVDVSLNTTRHESNNTLVTKHSINITGLAPSTIYHFVIKSADAKNNIKISNESAFMTNLN